MLRRLFALKAWSLFQGALGSNRNHYNATINSAVCQLALVFKLKKENFKLVFLQVDHELQKVNYTYIVLNYVPFFACWL